MDRSKRIETDSKFAMASKQVPTAGGPAVVVTGRFREPGQAMFSSSLSAGYRQQAKVTER